MVEKIAHDTRLYSLGKGILKLDRFDADGLPTGLRDVGNAPTFNLNVEIESLEHYSSREATKTLDLEVTMIRRLKGNFTLDEKDRENLRLYFLAKTGTFAIKPLTVAEIRGELDFVGTNEVGPRYHAQIWDAKIKGTGEQGFIQDADWGMLGFDFTAQSAADDHPDEPYADITLLGES